MEIAFLKDKDAKPKIVRLIQESQYVDIAVAWAGRNGVTNELLQHAAKLRHVVIGTHMYQTDPAVLRGFMEESTKVRCMPPSGRLFHPKVYLFERGTTITAMIGSHNMTTSAFEGRNIEASILIRGTLADQTISELATFIRTAWHDARRIDKDFLFAYQIQHALNRPKRDALSNFVLVKQPRSGAAKPSPLNVNWEKFVQSVKADVHHGFQERLDVLESAARMFNNGQSFARMSRDERRAIAGTYGSKESGIQNLPWAWFGTMFGQGDFKNLVNESPDGLSDALDAIPLEDPVMKENYDEFAQRFVAAFTGKSHIGGVATATRLLAMKRPDIFIGVNDANRRGICDAYGVAHSTLSLGNYWERIVIPTQLSPWWQHPRPKSNQEGRIWDNRAALIDCIYYSPRPRKT